MEKSGTFVIKTKNMARTGFIKEKIGAPPGYLGISYPKGNPTKVELIQYDKNGTSDVFLDTSETILEKIKPESVNWVRVVGLENINLISTLCSKFGIEPLNVEDILNPHHLPKIEQQQDYLLFFLNILIPDKKKGLIERIHVSYFLIENVLLSFAEKEHTLFDDIIKRIKTENNRIRERKADYLLYRLVDIIVDHYFFVIENIEDKIDDTEVKLLQNHSDNTVQTIVGIKKQLASVKRTITPLLEELRLINKEDLRMIEPQNIPFFNDVSDHLKQHVLAIDNIHDLLNNLMDVHMANISNRLNDVMKTLTVITSIFIPLSLLASIYGMNFKYMPELELKWAYPAFWIFLVTSGITMWLIMRKRKWF